jgi:hypothetical protein
MIKRIAYALAGALLASGPHAGEVVCLKPDGMPEPCKSRQPRGEYLEPGAPLPALTEAEIRRGKGYMPPSEYDHPFNGRVLVAQILEPEILRRLCITPPPFFFPPACAGRDLIVFPPESTGLKLESDCQILHLPVEYLQRHNLTVNLIIRHEIAHCNGWPKDHPGMR